MFNVKKNIFVNSIGDVLRCKRAPFIKLIVIAWISGGYKLNFYILFLVPSCVIGESLYYIFLKNIYTPVGIQS